MAQPPFDHNAPTHAQVADARARDKKIEDEKRKRVELWRTIGIWFFGMVGAAMVGAITCQIIMPYPREPVAGIIAGAAIFACVRLWLAEHRASAESKSAAPVRRA